MTRFAAVLIALCPTIAAAQVPCAPRAAIVEKLDRKYGERQAAIHLTSPTRVEELWGNPETGSWTILITRSDGLSCLKSSGAGFALPLVRDAAT